MGVKVTSHIGREKTGGDLFLTICDYEWKPLGFLRGLVGGVFTRIPDGFGLSACGAMFSIPARTKRHAGAASVQRRSRRPDERVSRARVKLARPPAAERAFRIAESPPISRADAFSSLENLFCIAKTET
ncbi:MULTISPECIES: hypothetical protein [Burkholderia]|uniref:hypothetical protein n=1 Tax=Burkholderia TaxID=32008 RepID=UPI0015C5BAE1|nr:MULTISPECIES: hypothetical protein [Burkholderia]EKS9798600.1 hypothetical protein [Burkholderia cepacia]EKS9802298.1 hypothetical protein [Burkholderia cepacia]EKS9809612.1 hypothetical protein [Burkholderia cepacia]EKS9822239.1 hypothetical protein [Burkholderia cepacia]EKS9824182.1 hypothetical protein [Burkholderia cepacia]